MVENHNDKMFQNYLHGSEKVIFAVVSCPNIMFHKELHYMLSKKKNTTKTPPFQLNTSKNTTFWQFGCKENYICKSLTHSHKE